MSKLHKRDLSAQRLTAPLRLKRATTSGTIEGYASTFNGPPESSTYGDIVAPGAFARTLAEHKDADTRPACLWCHDTSTPVGRWDELEEDSIGLRVVGQLNLETSAGRDAAAHIKAGDVGGLSIGFRIYEGGIRFEEGYTLLTSLMLAEVSVVTIPANIHARASVKAIGSREELVDVLREAGLAKAAGARRVAAAGGWSALAADGAAPDEIEAIRAAVRGSANKWR